MSTGALSYSKKRINPSSEILVNELDFLLARNVALISDVMSFALLLSDSYWRVQRM